MSMTNWTECSCSCHRGGGHIVHCMPCCVTCPTCGRHINFVSWKAHQDNHVQTVPPSTVVYKGDLDD